MTASGAIIVLLALLVRWYAVPVVRGPVTQGPSLTVFSIPAHDTARGRPARALPDPSSGPRVAVAAGPKPLVPETFGPANRGEAAALSADPPEGPGAASGAVQSGDSSAYLHILLAHLERFRRAPQLAGGPSEGVVTIGFSIDRQGNLLSVRVTGTSGSGALDAEAVSIIRRATPLPAIPAQFPDPIYVIVPVPFVPG